MTNQTLQNKAFVLLLVSVSLAFAAILWPLYEAVFWGVALAILFMPLHRRVLLRMRGRPNLAAFSTLLLCLVVVILPMTLISKPALPANNFKELSAWINQNKGKINLGNAGLGSASHLCGLMFQDAVKTDMTTVPYKGTAPAMTDLIGGQIDLMCDQTTNTTSQIEGKKVKVFGVTTTKHLTIPALKDVPTLEESGLKGFQVTIWHGLYAPKGTPADVQAKINAALKVALKDPEFIKKQEGLGAVVVVDKRVEPAEHKKFVAAEIAKWSPVIKAAGVYAD